MPAGPSMSGSPRPQPRCRWPRRMPRTWPRTSPAKRSRCMAESASPGNTICICTIGAHWPARRISATRRSIARPWRNRCWPDARFAGIFHTRGIFHIRTSAAARLGRGALFSTSTELGFQLAQHLVGVHRIEILAHSLDFAAADLAQEVIAILVGLAALHLGERLGLDRHAIALRRYSLHTQRKRAVNRGPELAEQLDELGLVPGSRQREVSLDPPGRRITERIQRGAGIAGVQV